MKKKQVKEVKTRSITELHQAELTCQKELVKLRSDLGAGRLKNFNEVADKRRELARIKTVLREKTL
jgi:ribosomal protein L29